LGKSEKLEIIILWLFRYDFLKIEYRLHHLISCFLLFVVVCSFSEELLKLLLPRFYFILDLNVASIRDTDPSRIGKIDTRPHYVS